MRRLAADGARERLALQHLLSAAGSSPRAAAAAVARFAARNPAIRFGRHSPNDGRRLHTGGKETALIDLLRRNPTEKKLVFVHSRETLARLADPLAQAGIASRVSTEVSAGRRRTRRSPRFGIMPVLLCTQSGGEGRNIQFCNTLINFDVPWNPMAIEQRIGRIDRIGQDREVFVFNLVTRGTLEEQMLALLDEKISMFELVVGEVGAILGGLEEERDFRIWCWMHGWGRLRRPRRAFEALGQRLEQARAAARGRQGAR